MSDKLSQVYDKAFYAKHATKTSLSADAILGLLFKHYQPQSVIDIGCGHGAWLSAAECLGADKLVGYDGPWVTQEKLLSDAIDLTTVDLDRALPELQDRYDLCISLEVAEHLNESRSEPFVSLLCEASDVILFSAAVSYQGGTNHRNEQWQSYWINIFDKRGYDCIDSIRPTVWNDKSVAYYYRQNTFLFVKRGTSHIDTARLRELERPIYDIAHPVNYEWKGALYQRAQDPSLRFIVGRLLLWFKKLWE